MQLETAKNRILKQVEKNPEAQEAIIKLFSLQKTQSVLEEWLVQIIEKHNLQQIWVNLFTILESTFSVAQTHKTFQQENYKK